MTKQCKICGNKYYCKDLCKICYERKARENPKRKEYMKNYYKKIQQTEEFKLKRNQYMKEWRKIPEVNARIKELRKNPERKANKKKYQKQYKQRPEVKSRVKEYRKEYEQRPYVRDRINKYQNNKIKSDPIFKLKHFLRIRLAAVLKRNNWTKNSSIMDIVGCTGQKLKEHIENQFTEGMNWSNHGSWHIDHKIPLASAETEQEVYELNHYTNLQPLWAEENLIKGCKK